MSGHNLKGSRFESLPIPDEVKAGDLVMSSFGELFCIVPTNSTEDGFNNENLVTIVWIGDISQTLDCGQWIGKRSSTAYGKHDFKQSYRFVANTNEILEYLSQPHDCS